MIYQDLYKRLEQKIGNKKKFDKLPPTEKESILKIAGVIAKVVGYDNVEIESKGSDIFFEDSNKYYLEVANDRDDSVQEGNADVDYVFIRFDITPQQAMEVLNLILIGIINEIKFNTYWHYQ